MLIPALALLMAEPVPTGEVSRIFTVEDYPLESVTNGEKGTVAVEADVNADGRVIGCRITRSSGSPRLDSTTCSIVSRRGRFVERAREHGGKLFTISTTVTWDLGPIGIPLAISVQKIIYTTGPAIACRSEASAWLSMPDACAVSRPSVEAAIKQLATGRNLEGLEYVIEIATIPGDHLADVKVGNGSGEELLGRQTALVTIAADGRPSGCVGGEDSLSGELADWCESMVTNERYEPLPASAENRGDRQLTKVNAIYLRPAAQR